MRWGVRWYLVGSGVLGVLGALAGCSGGNIFVEREPWRHEAEAQCINSGAIKEGAGIVRIKQIRGRGGFSAAGFGAGRGHDDARLFRRSAPAGIDPGRRRAAALADRRAGRGGARCPAALRDAPARLSVVPIAQRPAALARVARLSIHR